VKFFLAFFFLHIVFFSFLALYSLSSYDDNYNNNMHVFKDIDCSKFLVAREIKKKGGDGEGGGPKKAKSKQASHVHNG